MREKRAVPGAQGGEGAGVRGEDERDASGGRGPNYLARRAGARGFSPLEPVEQETAQVGAEGRGARSPGSRGSERAGRTRVPRAGRAEAEGSGAELGRGEAGGGVRRHGRGQSY